MIQRKNNVLSAIIGVIIGVVISTIAILSQQSDTEVIIKVEPTTIYVTDYVSETNNLKETTDEKIVEALAMIQNETDSEETTAKEEPYFPYTQEDIYLVGNMVFHEVGILLYKCPEKEAVLAARLTASCLVNRAKMNYFKLGNSISEQLVKSQYGSVERITANRQEDVPESFYEIAEDILQNGPEYSERLVFQAQFEQGEVVENIYNQYFGLISEKEYNWYKRQ